MVGKLWKPDEHSSSTLLKVLEKCAMHDFEIQQLVEVRATLDLRRFLGSSKTKTRIQENMQLHNKMKSNFSCFKILNLNKKIFVFRA